MTENDKPDLSGDWGGKLTERGELIVSDAPKEHTALIAEIESEPDSDEARGILKRDENGRVVERRGLPAKTQPKDVVPAGKRPDWNFENDGVTERQRDPETGRYVKATASKDALVKSWDREGGADKAIARVREVEQTILSRKTRRRYKLTSPSCPRTLR
jgi:hypothetical protein